MLKSGYLLLSPNPIHLKVLHSSSKDPRHNFQKGIRLDKFFRQRHHRNLSKNHNVFPKIQKTKLLYIIQGGAKVMGQGFQLIVHLLLV